MVLYVVGLGLGNEKNMTVRGLEAVRGSAKVFLEHTAAFQRVDVDNLEAFFGKDLVLAARVKGSETDISITAKDEDVSFLVVGDPFCGDSNRNLIVRARELGVQVEVIQNTSVLGAVAACGLQPYNFGQSVSIPNGSDTSKPGDFYEKIRVNKANGMHTLCLLDAEAKELGFEGKSRGDLHPRYMSVGTALRQLLEVGATEGMEVYGLDTQCVGLARLGQPTQQIVVGTMSELLEVDFGEPLCYLVICGPTDPVEDKMLQWHRVATDPVERSPVEQPPVNEDGAEVPSLDQGDSCIANCPFFHGLTAFTTPQMFNCDVCRASIPEGSRAFGCRRCNYDACTNCSTAHGTDRRSFGTPAEGDAATEASVGVSEAVNCPGLHGLSSFTPPSTFCCNLCGGSNLSRAFGCRRCDFDVCNDCSAIHGTNRFAVVEASQEDAEFNRASLADTQRRLEASRDTLERQLQERRHATRMTMRAFEGAERTKNIFRNL